MASSGNFSTENNDAQGKSFEIQVKCDLLVKLLVALSKDSTIKNPAFQR